MAIAGALVFHKHMLFQNRNHLQTGYTCSNDVIWKDSKLLLVKEKMLLSIICCFISCRERPNLSWENLWPDPFASFVLVCMLCIYFLWFEKKKNGKKICFNPFPNKPWFLLVCNTSLLKTQGKGEIARNEQFLLFPQCFLPIWMDFLPFSSNLKLLCANSFSLEESKNLSFGKGLSKPVIFKSHVCQNVRLLAISSGWVGGVYSGLKNHAKNWIKNVVYTS